MWGSLVKMLKVIDCMSRPCGAKKKEISEITGTSERHFYRIIKELEYYGVPLFPDKPEGEKENVWRIEESYTTKKNGKTLPSPNFTVSELFALCFLKGSSSIFHDSEMSRYVDSSYEKLKFVAPDKLRGVFERMESVFLARGRFSKSYSGHENIMMDILEAILGRKKCVIRYNSYKSGEIKEYTSMPLHFFQDNGGLYLLLHIYPAGEPRTFAIERILEVEMTKESFDYPNDFDAGKYINRPFGLISDSPFDCSISFSADVARYITERRWADDQTITENEDGSIILEMNTSGWSDVKRWILGYGRHAKVLAPEKMRLEIIEEAGAILKNNGR